MGTKSKTICLHMSKGGIGKTTMTMNLAYAMSRHGKTILIDADMQGNLTSQLADKNKINEKNELLSVLQKRTEVKDAIIPVRKESEENGCRGIDIIGTVSSKALQTYFEGEFRNSPFYLRKVIQELKESGYRYIFFDLPPSLPYYVNVILSYADEIIPIIEPEDLAVESMALYAKNLKEIQANLDAVFTDINYFIINKINRQSSVHEYFINDMKETMPFEIYEFNRSEAVVKANTNQMFLGEYMPSNKICAGLAQLAEKIASEE